MSFQRKSNLNDSRSSDNQKTTQFDMSSQRKSNLNDSRSSDNQKTTQFDMSSQRKSNLNQTRSNEATNNDYLTMLRNRKSNQPSARANSSQSNMLCNSDTVHKSSDKSNESNAKSNQNYLASLQNRQQVPRPEKVMMASSPATPDVDERQSYLASLQNRQQVQRPEKVSTSVEDQKHDYVEPSDDDYLLAMRNRICESQRNNSQKIQVPEIEEIIEPVVQYRSQICFEENEEIEIIPEQINVVVPDDIFDLESTSSSSDKSSNESEDESSDESEDESSDESEDESSDESEDESEDEIDVYQLCEDEENYDTEYNFNNTHGYNNKFTHKETQTFLINQATNGGFDPVQVRNAEKSVEEVESLKLTRMINNLTGTKKVSNVVNEKKRLLAEAKAKAEAKKLEKKAKKCLSTKSSKAQAIIDKNNEKKQIKKLSRDEEIIISMKVSMKKIKTLQEVGAWIKTITNIQYIIEALCLIFMNVSDLELRKNLFIEILSRTTIGDIPTTSVRRALTNFELTFNHDDQVIFAIQHRQNVMKPFSPLDHPVHSLEEFQREAVLAIENNINAIVSAPTSSGKTFIAQFGVCVKEYVVFTLPTSELVAQVTGTIRSRPHNSLPFTPITYLVDEQVYHDAGSRVLLGTPTDVLRYCMLHRAKGVQYDIDNIDQIGYTEHNSSICSDTFDINKVDLLIIDEFQQLNDEIQGTAMQTLIKLFSNCPTLLLSATISNIDECKDWLTYLKKDSMYPEVKSIVHNKRFINQVKQVYSNGGLHTISPLAVLTVQMIASGRLTNTEMQIPTPQLYELSRQIALHCPQIGDVSITNFFTDQVTLDICKQYEDFLKQTMTQIAQEYPEKMQLILDNYALQPTQIASLDVSDLYKLLKMLQEADMLCAMIFIFDTTLCHDTCYGLLDYMIEEEQRRYPLWRSNKEVQNKHCSMMSQQVKTSKSQIGNGEKDGDKKQMLDDRNDGNSDKCLGSFKAEITKIITNEIGKWQKTIDTLLSKNELTDDEKKLLELRQFNVRVYQIELHKVQAVQSLHMVNEFAPHPDYTFSNNTIAVETMERVKRTLDPPKHKKSKKQRMKEAKQGKKIKKEEEAKRVRIKYTHPFMLAIERGFTFYTKELKDLDSRFQGIAQMLIRDCGVKLIFSDASYAYGVNLPIRTVMFYNAEYNEIGMSNICRILAHQAGGRSGRRGFDTIGYVVYVGVNYENLILGEYLRITGTNPNTSFSLMPIMFNNRFKPSKLFKVSLADFNRHNAANTLLDGEEQCKEEQLVLFTEIEQSVKESASVHIYRYNEYKDHALPIRDLITFMTQMSYEGMQVTKYDIVEIVSSIVFNTIEDSPTFSNNNINRFMTKFEENQLQQGKLLLFGHKMTLVNAYKANVITDDAQQIMRELKYIAELIRIMYSNHYHTVAAWIPTCGKVYKELCKLIFKYTL